MRGWSRARSSLRRACWRERSWDKCHVRYVKVMPDVSWPAASWSSISEAIDRSGNLRAVSARMEVAPFAFISFSRPDTRAFKTTASSPGFDGLGCLLVVDAVAALHRLAHQASISWFAQSTQRGTSRKPIACIAFVSRGSSCGKNVYVFLLW